MVLLFLNLFLYPGAAQSMQQEVKKEPPLLLRNVTVIDGTGAEPQTNRTVLIQDREISGIFGEEFEKFPADARVFDFSGKYLIPGLIDSHVHLGTFPSGVDNRSANEKLLKEAFFKGITSLRDMAGDARAMASLARDAKLGDIISPDIYYSAVFFGSTFTSDQRAVAASGGEEVGEAPWARKISHETNLAQVIAEAKGAGVTGIKLYQDLSYELIQKITREAHRQGLQVWAHATVDPAFPRDLIQAGVDGISHFTLVFARPLKEMSGNAFKSLFAGKIEELPMEQLASHPPPMDDVFQFMKEQHTVFDPTIWISEYSSKYPAEYRDLACYYINKAEDMGIPQSTGTDQMDPTKPKIPLLRAIEMKVNVCGLTPLQAIRSATLYGAMAIGNEDQIGSVEPGKRANLVVLDSDPTEDITNLRDVEMVIKNGKIYDPDSAE